jgi:hypothetical protein
MMAVDSLDHSTDIEAPVVASSDSWTGGPPPKKVPSKFELWTKSHPKTSIAVGVVVIALIKADQARHWHSVSILQFVAMFLLILASVALIYLSLIGLVVGYNWFVRRTNRGVLMLQGIQKKYVVLLLFTGFLMSLVVAPALASRLPLMLIMIARHL